MDRHQTVEVADVVARLDALEARIAILDVIARYGPAVDAGRADAVACLWSPEGRYSYTIGDGAATLHGPDGLRSMVRSDMHQEIIGDGSGHLMGLPVVEVDGDTAVATGYSMLVRHHPQDGSFRIDRLSANRWELSCEAGRWRVVDRVNLLLDGRETARFLLGRVGEATVLEDG